MNQPAPLPANLAYVGFWIRVWASVVDSILLLVLIVPVGLYVFGANVLDPSEPSSDAAHFFLSWVIPALAVLVFWIQRQSTPGKLLFHARIVDAATGGEPRPLQLVVRYLGYYVSLLFVGLGFVWIAFDKRKQGLHDKIADTLVVRPTGPEYD
jgi:uncharacterized RDD family membrane protein YckC